MELAYKHYGTSGTDIVILHGLFGTLDNWQSIARKLGEAYRVTAFDLRNHGRSPHTEHFDISLMASDVYYMFRELNIGSAVMIGHSMGAKVSMHFALAYPAVTDGLISMDMAPKAYSRGHDDIFEALEKIDLSKITSRKEVEELLSRTIDEDGTIQFLMKNLSRDQVGEGFHWKMNLPVLKENYEEITFKIQSEYAYTGPALFLRGSRSKYVLDEDMTYIKTLFPYAVLETIGDAGHWLHADQPTATYEAIIGFMNNL
ncbi:MAG: alpha/beta fold hydrolase [Saprospiraceae bacterium]